MAGKSQFFGSSALRCFSSALAISAISLPGAVMAQDSEQEAEQTGGLNEIIVTAQRREESVQDVPIAISAFDEAELGRRGIQQALEVAQFVPNLVGFNNTGLGTANSYYLRGIGNTETIATFDPPIGTYVDDIYMSRQNANNLSLFDVERVEVLRGPQGTLFGRNTTGGAVSVFLKEPEDFLNGYLEVGYGSYDMKLVRGSVDLPLADTFAIKVSGYYQDDDGYAQNTTTGERFNESDSWGARLGLRGELSDNARWTASYMHTESGAANMLNFACDPANPSDCDGRFITTGLTKGGTFTSPIFGDLLTGDKNDFGLGNDVVTDFVSSNLELGLADGISVNIITGFVNIEQDFALDFADGRGLPSTSAPRPDVLGFTYGGFTIANDGTHTQFTQEVKFNAELGDGLVDLVGGVFYFHEDNDTDFGDIFTIELVVPPLGLNFPAPEGFPIILADRRLKNTTEAWAGYIQGDVNLTDALTVTAGVRYTDEKKTFDISDNRASCNDGTIEVTCLDNANLISANGTPIPTEQSVGIWTPRFAVNFEPNDDILLFASATRGFKSGGWNARAGSASALLPFAPELAWSYEAGAKTQLFDNRVQFNVTAFWLDISNLQTPSAFIDPDTGAISFITRNFADYRNKGVEIELNTALFDNLNIFGSFGYQDDNYRVDPNAGTDEFGITGLAPVQAICLQQLADGLIPNTAGADSASACGVGAISPSGAFSEPVRTPEFTFSMGASYDFEFDNGLVFTPAFNTNWRAESEVGTDNVTLFDGDVTGPISGTVYPANTIGIGDPITGSFSDDRWIFNASLTIAAEAGWSIVAECKNCFDKEAVESSLANYSYLNPPRTWAIRVKQQF